MTGGYEILEHTADVGIRSWSSTLEGCFEQAAYGLEEILGAASPGSLCDQTTGVSASASNIEGLLVDFLNELIHFHETREAMPGLIHIERMTDKELEAAVEYAPIAGEAETTGVKAATYHWVQVKETPDGVEARVYLDV
jgi:protein archease